MLTKLIAGFPSSREFVVRLPLILLKESFVKIARDGFGDSLIGLSSRMVVFARIHQRLDRFSLFVVGQDVPSLFFRELFPNVTFGEAKRGDRSFGVLLILP